MKKFLIQLSYFSLFAFIPILILTVGYFYFDPFKVIKNYNSYSNSHIISNRDCISTIMFTKNYNKYHYNSFILGSSRTLAYQPKVWQKYLDPRDVPFTFEASCESLDGMYDKLKYIDSKHIAIKNVLFIFCHDMTFNPPRTQTGHLYIRHPLTTGKSYISYHWQFIKGYFTPRFLINFYCYKIIGVYKPFMFGYINEKAAQFDAITNQMDFSDLEQKIARNPTAYYRNPKHRFYQRNEAQIDTVRRILAHQKLIFKKIKHILEKHKTHYKIVISPLYEQIKFSEADQTVLKNTFGNHIYDFSGINKWTQPRTNYYEKSHYRTFVGDSILSIIYK